MNTKDFRKWLWSSGKSKKVASDTISRLKKVELELRISIDDEYKKDRCLYLLSLFASSV